MITYLYVNNYKSLVNIRLDFSAISVLIGQNGSGKTAVFDVLYSLKSSIMGGRSTDIFKAASLTRWMKSSIQTFEIGMNNKNKEYVYHLELEYNTVGQCLVVSEVVKYEGSSIFSAQNGSVSIRDNGTSPGIEFRVDRSFSGLSSVLDGMPYQNIISFKQGISNLLLCKVNPYMKDQVTMEMPYPDVQFTNIGEVISYLSQIRPDIMVDLWNRLHEVNPAFIRLRIDMGAYGKHVVADYRYNDIPVTYLFSELSEGERMLTVLYLLLFGYLQAGYTVFIDEPDNYVSLREIHPWCSEVDEIATENNGQCIMITHHPEIINYFAGNSGIWMARISSGETIIKSKPAIEGNGDFLKYSELITGGYLDEI